jgi:hypothetical protein
MFASLSRVALWEKHMTPPVRYRIAEAKVKIKELRCK